MAVIELFDVIRFLVIKPVVNDIRLGINLNGGNYVINFLDFA